MYLSIELCWRGLQCICSSINSSRIYSDNSDLSVLHETGDLMGHAATLSDSFPPSKIVSKAWAPSLHSRRNLAEPRLGLAVRLLQWRVDRTACEWRRCAVAGPLVTLPAPVPRRWPNKRSGGDACVKTDYVSNPELNRSIIHKFVPWNRSFECGFENCNWKQQQAQYALKIGCTCWW